MDVFAGLHGQTLAGGLNWLHEPTAWEFTHGRLTVVPVGCTDFFRPRGQAGNDNAALLWVPVTGPFTARTYLRASLAGFGDAGVLTVRAAADQWAKLCVERSPIGDIGVVSVVTDPWSDDANSELLPSAASWLRVSRDGASFGMHYSLDGHRWRFVRAFTCDMPDTVMVGVHAQAPFMAGCSAEFTCLEIGHEPVADFRSGA